MKQTKQLSAEADVLMKPKAMRIAAMRTEAITTPASDLRYLRYLRYAPAYCDTYQSLVKAMPLVSYLSIYVR